MSYKTILAPIMFEETTQQIMDAALLLAGRFHGHVHALHIRQQYAYYPPVAYYPVAMDFPVMANEQQQTAAREFAEGLLAKVKASSDASGAHFSKEDAVGAVEGVTVNWNDGHAVIPIDFGRAARIADISVVCLPDRKGNALETPVFESLLMTSAKPVLIIPRTGLSSVPSRILIAWDGSQQSARAMDAGMPFLEQADEVVVVTVGEEDLGTPTPEEAAAYLKRRGANASATRIDWPKKPVIERIINQADAKNCDMIVMGGYSHARMYETLLGGATMDMLKHADRAVLMAH